MDVLMKSTCWGGCTYCLVHKMMLLLVAIELSSLSFVDRRLFFVMWHNDFEPLDFDNRCVALRSLVNFYLKVGSSIQVKGCSRVVWVYFWDTFLIFCNQ